MREHDIEVELIFTSTEDGGKSRPAWQGYRVDHDFGLPDTLNVAQHEFIDCDSVEPGHGARSKLWFMAPEYQHGRLYSGFKFTVQEGSRVVACGVISRVHNKALQKST
jgi:translation elongation factor EF-Tu-like GTPase